MHNILVTGGLGQLARAIRHVACEASDGYVFLSHDEADICRREALESAIAKHNIDIVINCAAYTDVERAEEDEAAARRINRDGVATLAEVCNSRGIKLIHISTDFVFGGDSERNVPYTEEVAAAPINAYGRTKAEGESEALRCRGAVVVRTSWLYSPWGRNFCRTILRLAQEHDTLRVVSDQRGTPTSALSLARMLVGLIQRGEIEQMSGIYHYSDAGEASWYDFACAIVAIGGIDCHIEPCLTAERNDKARRPHYSVLDKSCITKIEGVVIREWREALSECITLIRRER